MDAAQNTTTPRLGSTRGTPDSSEPVKPADIYVSLARINGNDVIISACLPLDEVAAIIRELQSLKAETEQIRQLRCKHGKDSSQYKAAKEQLRGCIPAAKARPGIPVKGLSPDEYANGLYGFDLDEGSSLDLGTIRGAVIGSPGAVMVGRSVGGEGLFAFYAGPVARNSNEYKANWLAIAAAMPEPARSANAAQSKNFNRLRFLAHDPDLWLAQSVSPLLLNTPPQAQPPTGQVGGYHQGQQRCRSEESDIAAVYHSALEHIEPPEEYNSWLAWITTLKALGFTCMEVEEWSSRGVNYQWGEVAQRWAGLTPAESEYEAQNRLRSQAHKNGWRQADPGRPASSRVDKPPLHVGEDLASEAETAGTEVLAHNRRNPWIFSIDHVDLVYTHSGQVRPFGATNCAVEMARHLRFGRHTKDGFSPKYPPEPLIKAVYEYLRQNAPEYNGSKRSPFIWKGKLVEHEGYHWPSGLYCTMPPEINRDLSIGESLNIIDEYFGEFAYDSDADRNNTLAQLFGIPLKTYGRAPICIIDKPLSQTGASKLAFSIAAVATGRMVKQLTHPEGMHAAEELDKRLVTALLDDPDTLLIDNIAQKFHSQILLSGMTSTYIGGRILGGSSAFWVRTDALSVYATGNNLAASKELVNRSIHVRLNAKMAQPEMRTGFRHQMPDDVLNEPRARMLLLSAICSVVQQWLDAGAPISEDGVNSGFSPFQKRISGLMTMLGLDYNRTRAAGILRRDADSSAEADFIADWWHQWADSLVNAALLIPLAKQHLPLGGHDTAGESRSLGRWLGARLGMSWLLDDPELPNHEVGLARHKKNRRKDPEDKIWQLVMKPPEMPL